MYQAISFMLLLLFIPRPDLLSFSKPRASQQKDPSLAEHKRLACALHKCHGKSSTSLRVKRLYYSKSEGYADYCQRSFFRDWAHVVDV